MQLIVISGLSGSGKSIALQTLEDEGFFCVDNLPLSFVQSFIEKFANQKSTKKLAIGIDARGFPEDLKEADQLFYELNQSNELQTKIIFLQSSDDVLLKRYHETRRKHPFSYKKRSLIDSIHYERTLLEPIIGYAHLIIDTSTLNVHELRSTLKSRVLNHTHNTLSIQLESFGYRYGAPLHADFIFDARCLTNPHWEPSLRILTGLDSEIVDYLNQAQDVQKYLNDLKRFFSEWLPKFEEGTRAYLTIAIGCTGGQHRSVYLVEQLKHIFDSKKHSIVIKHRELNVSQPI